MRKTIKTRAHKQQGNTLLEYLIALGSIALGLLMMMPSIQVALDSLNEEQRETHAIRTAYPPPLYDDSYQLVDPSQNNDGTANAPNQL